MSPSELTAVARLLATASDPAELTDARLRRAISTSYYAVFHTIRRTAALRFIGEGLDHAPGYAVPYRSFDHTQVARVCGELRKATLKDSYKQTLRRPSSGRDMQDFGNDFLSLQEARHHADYDPSAVVTQAGALAAITDAEVAIAAFHRVPDEEKSDVLTLVMVRLRD